MRSKSIGFMAQRVLAPLSRYRGLRDGELILAWPRIVGPDMAKWGTPLRIQPVGGGRRVLHIRVDNGGVALGFAYQKPVLMTKLNQYFGFDVVDDIRFLTMPLDSTLLPSPVIKPAPVLVDLDNEHNNEDFGNADPTTRALARLKKALDAKRNSEL
jgi:hypothetical protein